MRQLKVFSDTFLAEEASRSRTVLLFISSAAYYDAQRYPVTCRQHDELRRRITKINTTAIIQYHLIAAPAVTVLRLNKTGGKVMVVLCVCSGRTLPAVNSFNVQILQNAG